MTARALPVTRFQRLAVWKTLLISLPAILFTLLVVPMRFLGVSQATDVEGEGRLMLAALITWALLSTFFFLIIRTGQTYRFRSVLFIAFALLLPFYFIPNMIEQYGTIMLSEEMGFSGQASFCPLTMPMMIIPAMFKGIVVFPGSVVDGAAWFLLWLGASLAIGRGWCSWVCIYGGWDEFFSRLPKRARIKRLDPRWRLLPWGLLLAIVLISAITFEPFYCAWLCPFKTVTEFEAPTTIAAIIAMVIFLTLFLGLVIILPLLTKKRAQCSLLCPFGAMQSLFNKINIFEVRINPEACNECKRCIRECPTYSLDESSLQSGKALLSCTRCGQCVDQCTKSAITYHIKGTRIGVSANTARILFIYPAFLLFTLIGGGIIALGLWRIFNLITTGSMI